MSCSAFLSVLTTALLLIVIGDEGCAANGLNELDLSLADTSPSFLTVGPDGNLWATEATGNSILRIVPGDGTVTRFDTGIADEPTAICAGPDGNLWFGSARASFIGRITPAGALAVFTGFGNVQTRVLGICAGPDGNLWFTQFAGQRIGRITTAGAASDFNLPSGSDPVGICAGPDGNLWFTEFGSNRIGRITTGGTITHLDIPTPDSGPIGICAGPNNTLWFTEAASSKIGVIDAEGTVIAEHALPLGSQPNQIAVGPDGNLWFTELGSHRIGRISPRGDLTEFATPTARGGPDGIALLGNEIFVTENLASALASVPGGARLLRFGTSRVRTAESGAVKLTVVRRGNPAGAATGTASTIAGSAAEGEDFVAVSKNLSLASNGSARVSVPIVRDGRMESDETFTVALEATGMTLVAEPSSVEVTIVDSALSLFATSAGTYTGLVNDTATSHAGTGFLQLKLTSAGRFTGKLVLGGRNLRVTGALDSFGDFTGSVARGAEPPFTLTLHLDQSGPGELAGTITDDTLAAVFTLTRGFFNASNNPAPQAGRYTVLLESSVLPAGYGFGTLVVDGNGLARFAGTLGDATRVTIGSLLTADGKFPFFAAPYSPRGFITGVVTFQSSAASVADGALRWFRPAHAQSKHFSSGFDVTAQFLASGYAPPSPGTRVLNFPDQNDNARLVFTGGNLPLALPPKTVTLGADNKVTLSGPEPFRMKIQLGTGLFTGSVQDPSTGKPRTFNGALYQRTTVGGGLFPGDGETGRVDFIAAP